MSTKTKTPPKAEQAGTEDDATRRDKLNPLGTLRDWPIPTAGTPETLRSACFSYAPDDELERAAASVDDSDAAQLTRSELDVLLQRKAATVKACLDMVAYFRDALEKEGLSDALLEPAREFVRAGRNKEAAGDAHKAAEAALYTSRLASKTRSHPTAAERHEGKVGEVVIRLELGSPAKQAVASTLRAVFAPSPREAASYLFNAASAVARWWPKQQEPQKSSEWAHPGLIAVLNQGNPRIFPRPITA